MYFLLPQHPAFSVIECVEMAKRDSQYIKTWWERDFDEGAFKFRRLNSFAQQPLVEPELEAAAAAFAAGQQGQLHPADHAQVPPADQAQDVDMLAGN